MHITNLLTMTALSGALLLCSVQSFADEGHMATMSTQHQAEFSEDMRKDHSQHHDALILNKTKSQENQVINHFDHSAHLKEHGGQIYQQTTLQSKWLHRPDAQDAVKSELESRIGTDENKVFIKIHADKAESQRTEYDAKLLYSRNIADFWDVQTGIRYRNDQNRLIDQEQVDAVLGLHGLAPYFFETDAYFYLGQDQRLSFSLETERDLLLTQKLILKPYLEMNLIFSDHSDHAQQSGIDRAQFGIETRYEVSKMWMPFIDIAYAYEQSQSATAGQLDTASHRDWSYGAGLRLKF